LSGGRLTVQKTTNAFSSIPLDHAHEQNNELINRDGGVIRITGNPKALLRWMVAGPELVRMVKVSEYAVQKKDNPNHTLTPQHE